MFLQVILAGCEVVSPIARSIAVLPVPSDRPIVAASAASSAPAIPQVSFTSAGDPEEQNRKTAERCKCLRGVCCLQ